MLEKVQELGYKVIPESLRDMDYVVLTKGNVEIYLDGDAMTYTARDTKTNGHTPISDDLLEVLRANSFVASKVHKNVTGQV